MLSVFLVFLNLILKLFDWLVQRERTWSCSLLFVCFLLMLLVVSRELLNWGNWCADRGPHPLQSIPEKFLLFFLLFFVFIVAGVLQRFGASGSFVSRVFCFFRSNTWKFERCQDFRVVFFPRCTAWMQLYLSLICARVTVGILYFLEIDVIILFRLLAVFMQAPSEFGVAETIPVECRKSRSKSKWFLWSKPNNKINSNRIPIKCYRQKQVKALFKYIDTYAYTIPPGDIQNDKGNNWQRCKLCIYAISK